MKTRFRAAVTTAKGEKFLISSLNFDDDRLNFSVKVSDFLQRMGIKADHIEITEITEGD